MKLAPCGITCETCPLYFATVEPEAEQKHAIRADLAGKMSKGYAREVKPEEIGDCDGCMAGGRLFTGCANCKIRACALSRSLESCAFCGEYCCGELKKHFTRYPALKERIDGLRDGKEIRA